MNFKSFLRFRLEPDRSAQTRRPAVHPLEPEPLLEGGDLHPAAVVGEQKAHVLLPPFQLEIERRCLAVAEAVGDALLERVAEEPALGVAEGDVVDVAPHGDARAVRRFVDDPEQHILERRRTAAAREEMDALPQLLEGVFGLQVCRHDGALCPFGVAFDGKFCRLRLHDDRRDGMARRIVDVLGRCAGAPRAPSLP